MPSALTRSAIFWSLNFWYFSLILLIRSWTFSYDSLSWLNTNFSKFFISNASLFLNCSIFFSSLICSRNFLCFSACSFLTSACSSLTNFWSSFFLSLSSLISSFNSCSFAFSSFSFSNFNFFWNSIFSFSIIWILIFFCFSLSSWITCLIL